MPPHAALRAQDVNVLPGCRLLSNVRTRIWESSASELISTLGEGVSEGETPPFGAMHYHGSVMAAAGKVE